MTMKGQHPATMQNLLRIAEHAFREKRLCSSATYQAALGEAQAELDAEPHRDAHTITDLIFRHVRHTDCRGFFWEEPPQGSRDGYRTTAPFAGHLEFRHASKRYKDGWDAGKEPS